MAAASGKDDPVRRMVAVILRHLRPGTWATFTIRIEDGRLRLFAKQESWTPEKIPNVE